MIQPF